MIKITKTLRTVFKLIISLVFFSVLFSFVQENQLFDDFHKLSWPWFAISFALTLMQLIVSCCKWKIILDLKGKALSYWELQKIYFIGYFFSNILPSTFGGDVVRSYYAGQIINNQSYAAVSVVVERLSGVFFLFLLAGIAPFFQVGLLSNPYLFVPACVGLTCAAIIVWLYLAKNPFAVSNKVAEGLFSHLHRLTTRRFFVKLARPVNSAEGLYLKILERLKKLRTEIQIATDAVKNNKRFVSRLITLTVLFNMLMWVNIYATFRAFHVEVNFLTICALVPAIMLVAQVPVTVLGNLGYYESVFVFYFLLIGVHGADTLAMSLFLRVKAVILGLIGSVVYLSYRHKHRLPLEKGELKA